MAYDLANPPRLLVPGVGGGPNLWVYISEDARADVDDENYFSNGLDLGMKVNDVIFVIDSATPAAGIHIVNEVSATVVDIDDGTAIDATDTN